MKNKMWCLANTNTNKLIANWVSQIHGKDIYAIGFATKVELVKVIVRQEDGEEIRKIEIEIS